MYYSFRSFPWNGALPMVDKSSTARREAPDPSDAAFVEKFAAFLVGQGVLDELSEHRAQRAQLQSGERFDLVLTRLGLVSEADMARLLAEFLGLPWIDPHDLPETPLLADRLQLPFLMSNRIIPVQRTAKPCGWPWPTLSTRTLRLPSAICSGARSNAASCRPAKSNGPWNGSTAAATTVGGGRIAGARPGQRGRCPPPEGHGERGAGHPAGATSSSPRAVEAQASDIHIEPLEDQLRVRYRIDGVLHDGRDAAAGAARGDHLAHQDHGPARHRRAPAAAGRPHQARRARHGDRLARLDHADAATAKAWCCASSTAPASQLDFAALGFRRTSSHRLFASCSQQPNGIVLVTGPTGSGKTTTLYTGAQRAQHDRAQDLHRRGPDRVPAGRHQPDPGAAADRPDFRARAALDPAPGPRRHHGRRDPRPGDRADRRSRPR